MKMIRWTLAALVFGVAGIGTASANDNVGFSISFGAPGYYVAPPPVRYYAPPPVVYYSPPPVAYGYYEPRPFFYYGERRFHRDWDGDDHRWGRDHDRRDWGRHGWH